MSVQSPQPTTLLPPLIACLQTAAVSNRPPPDLLPLLSPILRQRVNLWAGGPHTKNWASILSWTTQRAEALVGQLESLDLEPHPVSGELEPPRDVSLRYRCLDQETIQCRLDTPELGLAFIYVWCPHEDDAALPSGWRLAELMHIDHDTDSSEPWADTLPHPRSSGHGSSTRKTTTERSNTDRDDDDDYWALYDQQPSDDESRNVQNTTAAAAPKMTGANPEQDYYARYDNEVQTAINDQEPNPSTTRSAPPVLSSQAQQAVAHHIASQIQSLSQLARSVNISPQEFTAIVKAQLDQNNTSQ